MNKNEFKPTIAFHPGEYMRDIIEDMEITQTEFAKRLNVSDKVLSSLLNGKSKLTTEIAAQLSSMTGTSIAVWLNLQTAYDQYQMQASIERSIEV